jgi:TonB family protein
MAEWSLANLGAWAVQAAALVAAGVWLPVRLRLGAPRARLLAFRALLVACVALPVLQPLRPAPPRPAMLAAKVDANAPGTRPSALAAPVPAGQRSATRLDRARTWVSTLPWGRIVPTALACGALLRLGWLGLGLASLARLRRSSTAIDPRVPGIEAAVRAVGTEAEFRESPRVRRPLTFGLRRPVVLVPPRFADLEPSQQRAIACHELLHVRRLDWLRAIGDEIVRAVLWFHPAIWWLVEQIHLSAEQAIDREVVRLFGDRRLYLRALLAEAEAGAVPRLQPAACFLDHGHLRQRIAMLMEEASMSRVRLATSCALVLGVLMTGGWFVVQAFPLHARIEVQVPQQAAPRATLATPSSPGPEMVTLDVSVLDRDHRPVRGLTAADFTVLEDGAPQVVSSLRESGSSYLLGYVSTNKGAPGNFRKTEVKVNRSGATVRTRSGYLEPKAPPPPAPPQAPASKAPTPPVPPPSAVPPAPAVAPVVPPAPPSAMVMPPPAAAPVAPPAPPSAMVMPPAPAVAPPAPPAAPVSRVPPPPAVAPAAPPDADLGYPNPPVAAPPAVPPSAPAGFMGGGTYRPAAAKATPALPPAPPSAAVAPPSSRPAAPALPVRIYRPNEAGVVAPTVISGPKPVYTRQAMDAKIEGNVVLSCVVGVDGTIVGVTVIKELEPGLDEAAITAARRWRFVPGTKDGKPVPVQVELEMTFTRR